MNQDRKEEIKKITKNLFEKVLIVPVPIIKLSNDSGLSVRELDLKNADHGGKLSGALMQVKDEWIAVVNENESATRKRFTIAHELGHFLLHANQQFLDDFPNGETYYRSLDNSSKNDIREKEANFFAANILMPEKEIEKHWNLEKDPSKLADKFNVSEVSITYRLVNLNYIK